MFSSWIWIPDPGGKMNADPDPQPCPQSKMQFEIHPILNKKNTHFGDGKQTVYSNKFLWKCILRTQMKLCAKFAPVLMKAVIYIF